MMALPVPKELDHKKLRIYLNTVRIVSINEDVPPVVPEHRDLSSEHRTQHQVMAAGQGVQGGRLNFSNSIH